MVPNINTRRICFFITILLLIIAGYFLPFVSAETITINDTNRNYVESRITTLDIIRARDTYFINYSEDGNEYRITENDYIGVREVNGIGLYIIEIDPHVSQKITFLDNYTLRVLIENNPNNPYPEPRIPLRLCINNNSVRNAKRFETDIPYCESDKEYYVGNILIGAEYAIRLNEDIRNTTGLIWWLGTDDLDGTFGQGGGLPVCSGVAVSLTLNETSVYYDQKINAVFSALYFPYQAGCTITDERLQALDTTSTWRLIPPAASPNPLVPFVCREGASCLVSPASWGTNYDRRISCNTTGNWSVRNLYRGTKSGVSYSVASPTRVVECLPPPVVAADDEEQWIIFTFILLGGTFGGLGYYARAKRRIRE